MDASIPIKSDGTLDIEAINNLPIIEYTKVVNKFTSKQREYYYSHLQTNDGTQHTKGIKFCPYDVVIKRGWGVDANEFLKRMRDKYLKKV